MKNIELLFTVTLEDNLATAQIFQGMILEGNKLAPVNYKYNSNKKYFEDKIKLRVRESRRYLNTFLEVNAQGGTGWKFEAFDKSGTTSLKKEEGETGDKSPLTKENERLPANKSQRYVTIDLKKLP